MPPVLALVLSIAVIVMLFRWERHMNRDVSSAMWIPFLWLFFIGTRFPSLWLDAGATMAHPDEYLDGSTTDQVVFGLLYVAGIVVLIRRRVSWTGVVSANLWIAAFLLYGLLSVLWSEYPLTSTKRFIKVLEHVVMVLVVLTEKNPAQAIDALFRRFLAIGVVLSVLFLKYYPELGRGFDSWSGAAVNYGVTTDKNSLGHICFLGAVFYTSSLFFRVHRDIATRPRWHTLSDVAMLSGVIWLLNIADAKTALGCAIVGVFCVLVLARTRLGTSPGVFVSAILTVVLAVALLEWAFGIRDVVIEALGRNATLTDRTYVWDDVLAVPINPIIGTGFESFWLGPRIEALWQKYWWRPNQAHNGYIETYLNLGMIGLALMVAMMISSLMKSLAWLRMNDPIGPIRFALLVGIAIYNYTDASFKAVHILFFTFFLLSISLVPARALSGASAVPMKPVPAGTPGGPGLTGL